jgi:hypothetical protein
MTQDLKGGFSCFCFDTVGNQFVRGWRVHKLPEVREVEDAMVKVAMTPSNAMTRRAYSMTEAPGQI